MWSDPIDELIAQFERLLHDPEHKAQMGDVNHSILTRVLNDAKRHRNLENKTGKVGFEATL